jgi:uncharacterized membrane protein YeaQ/YmgE (transglycosylase-associated protein family)
MIEGIGNSLAVAFAGDARHLREAHLMTIGSFILLLIVAGVCGAVAQSLVGYSHTGCLGSIALGFIGALLGPWLQRELGLPEIFMLNIGGQQFPIVWAIIGAVLFSAVLSLFARRRTLV